MVDLYSEWLDAYPIFSIEDDLGENDWDGWTANLTRGIESKLLVTICLLPNPNDSEGISMGAANAMLVKVNQVGTVAEALGAMDPQPMDSKCRLYVED